MSNKTGIQDLFTLVLIGLWGLLLNPICLAETTAGTISGRVVDEVTGDGVEGVTVLLNIKDWQSSTDEDGYFKFEKVPIVDDHEIRILINQEPYFTQIHEQAINMEGQREYILQDIIAKRGGAIEGSLKWGDGSPVLVMRVIVYAEGEIPGVYGAMPDKSGYYRVSKLPPGTDLNVAVACWDAAEGCGRIMKRGIRVSRDKTTHGVDFIVNAHPPIIRGKIVSQEGKPLRAHLQFWKKSEDMGHLISDANGNFSMSALEPGFYRIHVGYGDRTHKVSEDMTLDLRQDDRIKMDMTISEESIQFKAQQEKPPVSLPDVLEVKEKAELPLTELIFSLSGGYAVELKDLIMDAYENDVRIKAQSDCLPESVQTKVVNRLSDISRPLYILIKDKPKFRRVSTNGRYKKVIQCGGTPRRSQLIYLYPDSFVNSCGSLASVLFHELLHVVGLRHDDIYSYTKQCYGDEAADPPAMAGMNGQIKHKNGHK